MKKRLIYLLIALLIVSLCAPAFSACQSRDENESESSGGTETGTLSVSEHLSAEPNETDTLTETEKPTEKPTEAHTQEQTQTEKLTDAPTEKPTEKVTEAETEPPVSLKYISNGNGTCSVAGIGNYTDAYVIIPEKSPAGDVVTSIDDKAFFENSKIKAIQIPSTVMSIGDMAFGGCSALVYISVDQNNKVYTDLGGVLYSKDKARLICFPSASGAAEIFISVNVTEISAMAFYSTPSLKSIKYGGTLTDWNKIKIGDKNYGIYAASLSFAVTE